ncbi:MAG: hypothetical protein J6M66_07875 [Lachnospiraceae bacterium]|nr:hypothetical protein [Lachnospiraceae bacterium]
MKTEQIYVNGDEASTIKALENASEFSSESRLSPKNGRRVRLITEELLGMMRGLAGEYEAMFWIEGDATACQVHLTAKTAMDSAKRSDLIAASSSGKNAKAVGIMGKIRNLVEIGIQSFDESMKLTEEYGTMAIPFYEYGFNNYSSTASAAAVWSLANYKAAVEQQQEAGEAEAAEAWDELEKSVIANVADDIQVGIRKDTVEMVVLKKF